MSTVLSIHVWEWSDWPGYQVDVAVQRGPDYASLLRAEARDFHLEPTIQRAEAALWAWGCTGLIGLVSYFESLPLIWTLKEY